MGLLDEIMKSLEEAQREAEGRRAPAARRPGRPAAMPAPERTTDADEDEAADEVDDIAERRQAVVRQVAVAPPPVEAPRRAATHSAPAEARHVLHGPQVADRIRMMMRNPQALRDALIAREILGPPPGLRRLRRR